jgi:hypothetical protein
MDGRILIVVSFLSIGPSAIKLTQQAMSISPDVQYGFSETGRFDSHKTETLLMSPCPHAAIEFGAEAMVGGLYPSGFFDETISRLSLGECRCRPHDLNHNACGV